MRSWIALSLPLLPLEIYRPRWCEAGVHVVLDHGRVLAMTGEARHAGVRLGMHKGGVLTVAPEAALHERDVAREEASLQDVALAMLQYTPEVALMQGAGVLLDVTASLRAFYGHRAIARRILATVTDMGLTPQLGMAPTAQGAWLLAAQSRGRWPVRRRVIRLPHLRRMLDKLPLHVVSAIEPYCDLLNGIGCRSLGDVRKLPRAGLQRRTDKMVLRTLDQAYGEAPEMFAWIQAPPNFSARLELPDRAEHTEGLVHAAHRLLLQMTGWLQARQLAVSACVFALEHERGRTACPPTLVEIALAEAVWQETHLLRLLKEKLGRIALSAAVIAIKLEATQLSPMRPPSASLFPEPGRQASDYHRLLEMLTACLGDQAVLMPSPLADYRPEAGNKWIPALQYRVMAFKPLPAERPCWLLEKPLALAMRDNRPCYGSPLALTKGPERIECGWWDSGFAVRDYFVAQDRDAVCYWIYRERLGEGVHWFLHGLFA